MTDALIYVCFAGATFAGFILGVLTCAAYSAPEGYEKDGKFHYGREDDEK